MRRPVHSNSRFLLVARHVQDDAVPGAKGRLARHADHHGEIVVRGGGVRGGGGGVVVLREREALVDLSRVAPDAADEARDVVHRVVDRMGEVAAMRRVTPELEIFLTSYLSSQIEKTKRKKMVEWYKKIYEKGKANGFPTPLHSTYIAKVSPSAYSSTSSWRSPRLHTGHVSAPSLLHSLAVIWVLRCCCRHARQASAKHLQ